MISTKLIFSGISVLTVAGAVFAINNSSLLTKTSKKQLPDSLEDNELEESNTKTPTPINQQQSAELEDNLNYQYLIVETTSVNSEENLGEFTENNGNIKNYKCSFEQANSNSISDDSCNLYSLNKSNDIFQISHDWNTRLKTNKPTTNDFYILRIDFDKYKLSNKKNKTIKLLNKTNNKEFATVTVKTKLMEMNKKIETNIILAKITKNNKTPSITSETTDFYCKTNARSIKVECKVFMFNQDPTTTSGVTTIKTNQISKISSNSDTKLNVDKYVLIQINNKKYSRTEEKLRSYMPEIFLNKSENSPLLKTKYVDAFVGAIDSTTPTNSKLLKLEQEAQEYLVFVEESSTRPTQQLKEGDRKNYKCKLFRTNIEDENCTLIRIEEPTNRSINLSDVRNANQEVLNKEEITNKKYFKLKIKNQELISKNITNWKTIIIKPKTSNDNFGYAAVKIIAKLFNNRQEGITNWFLAKSDTSISGNQSISNFYCGLKPKGEKSNCAIYKSTNNFQTNQSGENNLTGFTKTSLTKSDITKDKYVIVGLNNWQSINDWSNKTINVTSLVDTNLNSTFKLIAPLNVSLSEDFNTIKQNHLILT